MSRLFGIKRVGIVLGALSLVAALTATPALGAGQGLPRSYDVQTIDPPPPLFPPSPPGVRDANNGGRFGWGLSNAGDLDGDGEQDLLTARSESALQGEVDAYSGRTGALIDRIPPPEPGPANNPAVLAFVYVEKIADLGSCPSGTSGETCPGAPDPGNPARRAIGGPDNVPEIIAGSRNLAVPAATGSGTVRAGRAYVIDGRTRAVLKKIDPPRTTADRVNGAQFGRLVFSPSGLPPCDGLTAYGEEARGEGNDAGVATCPRLSDNPERDRAVRIGDMDGGGRADMVISARNIEGVYVYRGEDVAGSDPGEILETPRFKIPKPVTQGMEFGGNFFRIGDVGRCPASPAPDPGARCPSAAGQVQIPDGRPEVIVQGRNADYPLSAPQPEFEDTGASFLYDGATGTLLNTYTHPEPQLRSRFTDSFHTGLAPGNLGAGGAPDIFHGAPFQNVAPNTTDDGRGYVLAPFRQGGGGEGSFQFATLDDPTPATGGNFGSTQTGVGDLEPGPDAPDNELLLGGFGPFDPETEKSRKLLGDVHFFNATTERVLQTIPDPTQDPGSGFGVGISPLGDLNDDGFLDFAVSAYLANIPPGSSADEGRVFIFRSNNSPSVVGAPTALQPGVCANDNRGTDGDDQLVGTLLGDRIFALGGNDDVDALQGFDCIFGGSGRDSLEGAHGNDRLEGEGGRDSLSGGDGADTLVGGPDKDKLNGGGNRDTLRGGSGNDQMSGASDEDRLSGGPGHDRLTGGTGKNALFGGAGNDKLVAIAFNGRREIVDCGRGRDTALVDRTDRVRSCERVRRLR